MTYAKYMGSLYDEDKWNEHSLVEEECYSPLGYWFTIKEDGWLRLFGVCENVIALMTRRLGTKREGSQFGWEDFGTFNFPFQKYNAAQEYERWYSTVYIDVSGPSQMVFFNSKGTSLANTPSDVPLSGNSGCPWVALDTRLPGIAVFSMTASAGGDRIHIQEFLPVKKGEEYVFIQAHTSDTGHAAIRTEQWRIGGGIRNKAWCQFLPKKYTGTKVGVEVDSSWRIPDNVYYFDTYRQTLSGIPLDFAVTNPDVPR